MKSSSMRPWTLGIAIAGLALAAGCEGFNFSFSFTVPKKAEASNTQTVAMPDGAGLVVVNDVGSTRVTVDPTATEASIEIMRTALAETQEEADALLEEIVVTVTEPTVDDNNLRIDAPKPAGASDTAGDFNITVNEDEVTVVSISNNQMVANVRLRIILPPGHAADVTQKVGQVRGVELDTPSILRNSSGGIRAIACETALSTRTGTGGVIIESHRGSLDVEIGTGGLECDIVGLGVDDTIDVSIGTGGTELTLPDDVDADLDALTEAGSIEIRRRDFDDVDTIEQTQRRLIATLNDGGADINLRTELGSIYVEGR